MDFLDLVFSAPSVIDAVGFKIFDNQNMSAFNYLLNNKSIKKVLLVRENLIRCYVSEQLALQTGKWDRLSSSDIPSLNRMYFKITDFEKFVERIENYVHKVECSLISNNQEFIKLTYEEIVKEFPTERVSDFLSIPLKSISFEVNQKKQNPFPLSAIIENYHEIYKEFQGSRWESLLNN